MEDMYLKSRQLKWLLVGAALCLIMIHRPGLGIAEEGIEISPISVHQVDCGYVETSNDLEEPKKGNFHNVALPDNDVFRPLLADPKEPRFSGSFLRVRFRECWGVGDC